MEDIKLLVLIQFRLGGGGTSKLKRLNLNHQGINNQLTFA